MPTNYRRGVALEYEIKGIFEKAGWSVLRGASSKGDVFGFPTDLVVSKLTAGNEKTGLMILVQAKLNKRRIKKRGTPKVAANPHVEGVFTDAGLCAFCENQWPCASAQGSKKLGTPKVAAGTPAEHGVII